MSMLNKKKRIVKILLLQYYHCTGSRILENPNYIPLILSRHSDSFSSIQNMFLIVTYCLTENRSVFLVMNIGLLGFVRKRAINVASVYKKNKDTVKV